MLKIFANLFWIYTPGYFQKEFSRLFSKIFSLSLSRHFIFIYCILFSLKPDYLELFESESGETEYSSYSEFFKRKYKTAPEIKGKIIWPCEGYICDWGHFTEKNHSLVKGQILDLNSIFNSNAEITKDYFFTNIFLHNHNYHRIHSPVSGQITKITTIPGDLVFLRPWFYNKNEVSYPAFRNERVVFEIKDITGKNWYLAMVGGFGVATIEIARALINGGDVQVGQEIAHFKLGSTVCLATPVEIKTNQYLEKVFVGQKLETETQA